MAKPSDRFANFYTNDVLTAGQEILVIDREHFGHKFREVVLSIRPHNNDAVIVATISDSAFLAKAGHIHKYTIGSKATAGKLRTQQTFLLASNSSKNLHVASVDQRQSTSRAYYSSDITLFWLDSDFNTRSYTPHLLTFTGESVDPTQEYDITKNKGTNMSNVKSPNGTRTVNGSTIANLPDHQLIPTLVNLRGVLSLVEAGSVTAKTVTDLTSYNAKDLEDGEVVLLAEIKFRSEREILAEIARLEAEALELRSREERQASVQAELAKLKAAVETPVVEVVTTAAKRKR